MTKSYDLSFSATKLVKEYPHSPAFNSIYNYITQNVLLKDKISQRMVIANAENYVIANGVLFRSVKEKKTFETPMKCLLVIPEKFENNVFYMFYNTLLGAHYGPVNTYYTIKDRYWMHNMFEKLQRYISSCNACQQQKWKRGKIPYFHPRIPLHSDIPALLPNQGINFLSEAEHLLNEPDKEQSAEVTNKTCFKRSIDEILTLPEKLRLESYWTK